MKFSLGSDHAGFNWKEKVKALLVELGHEVVDHGTTSTESVDYPDFGARVAEDVSAGRANFGVTVCGTGNGMNMTVNRVPGVRGALVLNPEMAMYARAHNDANVLTLAEKYTPESDLPEIIKLWLETPVEGGRHIARVGKMSALEAKRSEDCIK
jgi:ribose 5-phosphate isomerase B